MDKQTLYKIQTDGSEMEQILKEQIDRFIFNGKAIRMTAWIKDVETVHVLGEIPYQFSS